MGLNLATILRESARRWPGRSATILDGDAISHGALHEQAQRFAGALRQLGVRAGQHVALMAPNVPHFCIAYFGGLYAATPIVPLNVLLTPDEIAYHLDDSEAVALIAWSDLLPQARAGFERVESCQHLIVAQPSAGPAAEGTHDLLTLCENARPITDLPPTMPDDTAVVLYTSGTTGRPKGAELTHFNLYYNAEIVAGQLLRLDHETVAAATLPLFHSFGQTVMQNAVLSVGGTVVLVPRFEPLAVLELMQRHRVTFFAGVPTMYIAMLQHPEADRYDLAALRCCMSGGAAMPVEVMTRFDEKYGVNILEGYGLSETSPVACSNVLDRPKRAGSIGLPLRGVEFRLVDEQGQLVEAPDVPGELCIKGHNIMRGYYNRPEATAAAIEQGWFRSGDIATRDADGYYYIVDRKKDMIIRGGYNVYPREVEEVLYAHPAIAEAAVIGIPDALHGEEIKAVIALKPEHELSDAELVAYCKEHLAAYKYPRRIERVAALPKGPTGKILKRQLRQQGPS